MLLGSSPVRSKKAINLQFTPDNVLIVIPTLYHCRDGPHLVLIPVNHLQISKEQTLLLRIGLCVWLPNKLGIVMMGFIGVLQDTDGSQSDAV